MNETLPEKHRLDLLREESMSDLINREKLINSIITKACTGCNGDDCDDCDDCKVTDCL